MLLLRLALQRNFLSHSGNNAIFVRAAREARVAPFSSDEVQKHACFVYLFSCSVSEQNAFCVRLDGIKYVISRCPIITEADNQ